MPIVPSSPGILSNRRPAKLSLYDPLRYGVLSSDDRYSVHCHYSTLIPLPQARICGRSCQVVLEFLSGKQQGQGSSWAKGLAGLLCKAGLSKGQRIRVQRKLIAFILRCFVCLPAGILSLPGRALFCEMRAFSFVHLNPDRFSLH